MTRVIRLGKTRKLDCLQGFWTRTGLTGHWRLFVLVSSSFYRAMHFSAKRGIAIACLSVRPSVRPSVRL